jgi:hypothetical protein
MRRRGLCFVAPDISGVLSGTHRRGIFPNWAGQRGPEKASGFRPQFPTDARSLAGDARGDKAEEAEEDRQALRSQTRDGVIDRVAKFMQ